MNMPLGVILAGGQARRMGGGDKGRLMLGKTSLFERAIERLQNQVSGIALNANGPAERFSDMNLPIIADNTPGFLGPLAGVLSGLDWAHDQRVELIVTIAADTPFFPSNLVSKFLEMAQGMPAPLVLAATKDSTGKTWRHPTFGLWPVCLRNDLRKNLTEGLRKVLLWTERHQGRDAFFEVNSFDPFFNINTVEDLKIAQNFLEAGL